MKKKTGNGSEPKHLPSLVVPRAEAQQKIAKRMTMGRELRDQDMAVISNENDLTRARNEYYRWSDYNKELLQRLFDDQSIAEEYYHMWGTVIRGTSSLAVKVKDLQDDITEKIARLGRIQGRLELIPELKEPETVTADDTPPKAVGRKVFVVHGHDEEAKEKAASLLSKLRLEPVILHEQANEGKTIIEKFEQHADVGFAVVLLTPDDVGAPREAEGQPRARARQNVILELGFFLGKLGRSRVCALHKGQVEIPSDYAGVIYLHMDEAGGWQISLARELKAAGTEVDLNLLA